jgi:DNA processing protein
VRLDDGSRARAIALASCTLLQQARLRDLLRLHHVDVAYDLIVSGSLPRPEAIFRSVKTPPGELLREAAIELAGIGLDEALTGATGLGDVVVIGEPHYPSVLNGLQHPPAVLFHRGSLELLKKPRVTIVGTRRATALGRTIASDMAMTVSAAGVSVVSGLAAGIDAAAHSGVIEAGGAPPIAVVGTGLDVPYPRSSAKVWDQVAADGLVLTEYPPGAQPLQWRFPERNRILAALGELCVVVESHVAGGSMITVRLADDLGRTICAVPGSVRSPASEGPNKLLVEGCTPVRDGDDVLSVLGLETMGQLPFDNRVQPEGLAADVVAQLGVQSHDLSSLVETLECDPITLARSLGWLEASGWITSDRGWFDLRPRARATPR